MALYLGRQLGEADLLRSGTMKWAIPERQCFFGVERLDKTEQEIVLGNFVGCPVNADFMKK